MNNKQDLVSILLRAIHLIIANGESDYLLKHVAEALLKELKRELLCH